MSTDPIPAHLARRFRDAVDFYQSSWSPAVHGREVSINRKSCKINQVCEVVSDYTDNLPDDTMRKGNIGSVLAKPRLAYSHGATVRARGPGSSGTAALEWAAWSMGCRKSCRKQTAVFIDSWPMEVRERGDSKCPR
jgi:hypothetical protein